MKSTWIVLPLTAVLALCAPGCGGSGSTSGGNSGQDVAPAESEEQEAEPTENTEQGATAEEDIEQDATAEEDVEQDSAPLESVGQGVIVVESGAQRFEINGVSFEVPEDMDIKQTSDSDKMIEYSGSTSQGKIIVRISPDEDNTTPNGYPPENADYTVDGYPISSWMAGDDGAWQVYTFHKDGNQYRILVGCKTIDELNQFAPTVLNSLRIR